MKLKEISRTATFAWGLSASSLPLLATGTVSGALDETFSNIGQLEIWEPEFFDGREDKEGMELGVEGGRGPRASVQTNARFNRLAWSSPSSTAPRGVLASGMETGEISVWDVNKILGGSSTEESLLFKNEQHTGPVRGLDFNPIQQNLFASGAINAELYVFDLTAPTKSHTTGPRSTKLEEITSLQWNPIVPHILASSSSSGYTSVWDLRGKKEVISLMYGGGAATGMSGGGMGGMQVGSRRGMSDVCWQPNTSTRLITSSEDDTSPIIMVWDLRNSRAPEKILTGHDKGVLSVSWCKEDADMLLSCGKDNRTICWNPQTCEIVGELPSSSNWSFQTAWCPRNPDILATASFDGKIGIHTLQSTDEKSESAGSKVHTTNVDDIFGGGGGSSYGEESKPVMSLKQPPKWLKRPVAASFGFGGQLTSASNLPGASGKHQSGVVHIRQIVTEPEVVDRAKKLQEVTGSKDELKTFCETMTDQVRADATTAAGWKALCSLFSDSKEEIVSLLGFSKEEISIQVSEAIKKFKLDTSNEPNADLETPGTPKESAISIGKRTEEAGTDTVKPADATPSEISATSDVTKKTEAETEATEQSLFGEPDEAAIAAAATPGVDAVGGADFFSSIGNLRSALPDHVAVPHQSYAKDSSVAATIGSKASSITSDNLKVNTFKIYPSDESEVDRLITRALVMGDFESAVTLSLSVDRFADALVLAVKGGPELLQKTQKAYFERRTIALPYLRLFQSIVSNDLSDVVQNADLAEWREIFVVLCTFARPDEFNNLAEQLGQRLEFRYKVAQNSEDQHKAAHAKELRKDALLCYLAAGKLEKLVKIWSEEMREEEEASIRAPGQSEKGVSRYTAHAAALQTFIEKVVVFKVASGYEDVDLAHPTQSEAAAESGARIYRLAGLYDRYYEYADLLATQGLVELAVQYIAATPADYRGADGNDSGLASARERYMSGAKVRWTAPAAASSSAADGLGRPQQPPAPVSAYATPGYGIPQPLAPSTTSAAPVTNTFSPYAPQLSDVSTNPYAVASTSQSQSNQPSGYGVPAQRQNQYDGQQQQQHYGGQAQYNQPSQTPYPPPPPIQRPRTSDQGPPQIPASQRRDIPGWNDAPSIAAPPKRPISASGGGKPVAIMSPFPNSQPEVPPQSPAGQINGGQQSYFAPPPRSQGPPANLAPPPRAGSAPRPPPSNLVRTGSQSPRAGPPPPGRAGPPPGAVAGPPPQRAMSPLVPIEHRVLSPPAQMQPRPPSANPYMQQQAAPVVPVAPPMGAYNPPPSNGALRSGPPPPSSPPSTTPAAAIRPAPPAKPEPSKSKYPAGDRSHIPAGSQTIYNTLAGELGRVKQITPPQQKRFVDDTERRLNILFDALNCDTIAPETLSELGEIAKAIAARNSDVALNLHLEMLTRGTRGNDFGVWMTGIKQLVRLGVY